MTDAAPAGREGFREGQVEAGGFVLSYWEGRPSQSSSAVVLLEGVDWFSGQIRDALAADYHTISLQLPGFGTSPDNATSGTVKEMADTAAQAVAGVLTDRYTLIGSSFSAQVALWQALRWPDRVEALVLISPRAILPAGGPLAPSPDQIPRLLARPENASTVPVVAQDVLAGELALAQRLGDGVHDSEAEARLGSVQCPTLVVFGLKDRTVSGEATSVYRENILNCNISIVYDAGHLVLAERPQALITAVADYVERRETFIVGRQSSIINP